MTTVMCFGSFDVIHPGHLYYLRESKKEGDKLIVVIARDKSIKKIKGKEPKYSEKERLEHIRETSIVDIALLGSETDFLEPVKKYMPDLICLGYDQKTFEFEELKEKLKESGLKTDVLRINPYKEHIYKSSKLKEKNNAFFN